MAIRAKNLGAHCTALGDAVQIQYVCQETGLRKRAAPSMHHWMAGDGGNSKLRDHVQRIARRDRAHREVPIDWKHLLRRAGAMAAEAVLILINGGRQHTDSVAGVDAGDVLL